MTAAKIFGVGSLIVLLVIIGLLLIGRPPTVWRQVTADMNRSAIYLLLGEPVFSNEKTKGGVWWRKDLLIGKWEFVVFFHDDNSVGAMGKYWKWNW